MTMKYIKPKIEIIRIKEKSNLMGTSNREGAVEVDPRDAMDTGLSNSKGNTPTWSEGVNTWDAWEE